MHDIIENTLESQKIKQGRSQVGYSD